MADHWLALMGGLGAVLIGFSKLGMPGATILAVPLLAQVFGARLSVGGTLPLLLLGDVLALAIHRSHADWVALRRLMPWLGAGMLAGALVQWMLASVHFARDPFGPFIGAIVLSLLAVTAGQDRLGDRLRPHSPSGTAFTGALAGLTTQVANAAGPVMSIYTTALGLNKSQLLGTVSWTFFIVNSSKLPLLLLVSLGDPQRPFLTRDSLLLSVSLMPFVLIGAVLGWLFFRFIPERLFRSAVLFLAAVAALWLMVKPG